MVVSRPIAVSQTWAWITLASNQHMAEMAIVLAGSLRRVKTSGKLVVITSPHLPEKSRDQLYKHFDLVSVMDDDATMSNVGIEAQAKVFAFSLKLFHGCVYLSPDSLVMKKCDEIIACCSRHNSFVALPKDGISEIFTFVPSVTHFHSLKKILQTIQNKSDGKECKDNFSMCIHEYAKINKLNVDVIDNDNRLYHQFKYEGNLYDGPAKDLSILNFGCLDPHGAYMQSGAKCMGLIESYAVDLWWNIYHNVVHQKNGLTDTCPQPGFMNQCAEDKDPVAIIGISCRLPGANNLDEFWKLLIEGREGITQLPANRWKKEHTITTASAKCRKTNGGFLDFPIDEFDAKFFNLSTKEAEFLDPQQRLLHEITWEALEDAGIDPLSLRGQHVGVFVGSWIHDYRDIAVKSQDRDFFRIYMGNSLASTCSRLSFFLGITGPSIAHESGCSSSIGAIDLACKSLERGETNMAIASGVNLFLHPWLDNINFVLSPDGRCHTFDRKANGFGRAEGCGVLILKRMSDALRDGDNIWAVIKGSALCQEGLSRSLGTPTVHCEALAMKLALEDADIKPEQVSFLETHGTGTSVGDPMEVAAIERVYSKNRKEPLIIASVKTNLGHTEAASGITGVIKVVLQLKNEMIVPHLNFSELNPEINLDSIPAQIPLFPMEWRRKSNGTPRLAGVSSFGISGTDGHVIIEEAPLSTKGTEEVNVNLHIERPYHIMKISAKTEKALEQLLASYQKLLEEQSLEENKNRLFPDIAYTSNVGRATFNQRVVIVAKDAAEAANMIKNRAYKQKEVHGGIEAKICFLFTGQGSQYKSMAQELFFSSPVFRLSFDKCDYLLKTNHNLHLSQVMWEELDNDKASVVSRVSNGLLDHTLYSQIAIFVIDYCLYRLWESWGIKVDFALGHSLGEYVAAVCSGALSLESALELVVHRSRLIDALPQGTMLVLKASISEAKELIKAFEQVKGHALAKLLDIAAINSPDQTVVAGDSAIVQKFADFCTERQVKCVVLAATHAFHSHHMNSILEDYRKIVENVLSRERENRSGLKLNSCQFISGMDGKLLSDIDTILTSDYWVRHTREMVRFADASKAAFQEGCNLFIEVGPSPILSAFIIKNNPNGNNILCLPSLRKNQSDWITMLDSLSKLILSDFTNIGIDWKGFDQLHRRRKVSLPFYPFQRKKIWVNFRSTPGKIHPLVGSLVPNASKTIIFENDITLKQISYLNDHAIGNTVIYPGAAFLEMCVAAGHCAVQGLFDEFSSPRRAITVKGLRIEAPLSIQDGKACRLQTIINIKEGDEAEEMGYSVRIFNWFQDMDKSVDSGLDGQWKSHASAIFMPMVIDNSMPCLMQVNITEIKDNGEQLSASKDLYDKLPEVGLRFGSRFQSLVSGWKHKMENFQDGILFEVKVPTDDHETYIVHPVVLDAMLQAAMLWGNKDRIHKKLYVPVHIHEFIWLSDGNGDYSTRYVFCTTVKGENCVQQINTLLLDSSGSVLASMNGVEFIETSVKLVESVIHQQSSAMPQLWEEIWKLKNGPLYGKAKPTPVEQLSETSISKELVKTCEKLNKLDEKELRTYLHLDDLTMNYFLNALYQIGWEPKLGEEIVLKKFLKQYGIVDGAWNFMRYFFNELVRDGIVNILVNEKERFVFKIVKLPHSKEIIEQLCTQTVVEGEASRGDYRIISEMGKGLKDFLVGNASPLSTLFPEDPTKPNMGSFYDTIRPWVSKSGEILNNALSSYNHLFYTKDTKDSVIFRVLEVGSGTGSGTKDYLEFLDSRRVNYEYTFSDVSSAFFLNAEVKFQKHAKEKQMRFQKFNIEQDPLAQGFTPEYFDLIIACEVIHATKDIRETLRNLRMLLKTSGHIQITETTKPDRRITLLVGLLEGYWRYVDFDLRQHHATMSSEKWINVLNSTGYTLAASIATYQNCHSYIYAFAAEENSIETGRKSIFSEQGNRPDRYTWLLFSDGSSLSREIEKRLTFLNRKVTVLEKDMFYRRDSLESEKEKIFRVVKNLEGDTFEGVVYTWALSPGPDDKQGQLSLPFLHFCQGFLELTKVTARLYILTRGAFMAVEDSECANYAASTVWGIAKTLRNEQPDVNTRCIDLCPNQTLDDQINNAFYELFWNQEGEDLIAFRGNSRLVPRLASLKIPDDSLSLSSFHDRFQLILPATKSISDLEFGPLGSYALDEDEVEVQVKCCALNFRDLFAVLKPTAQFDSINSIGSDFSGIITKTGSKVTKSKVGDPVFGMNIAQQALPSHLKTKENMVIAVPHDFTFEEASTIPAVFATALYCLVKVAKIGKGDVCLIHTASGGVGIAAIQIAKFVGADIIATAGSRRKRAYLRSLGIQHVFHSRTTEYGDEILEVTKGQGVTIVLNSLTGPGFVESSIKACAKHARFVEMSKLNIWKAEQVHEIRPDIDYVVADLTALKENEWNLLMDEMIRCMKENCVKPIPYTRFDAVNIINALGYLQKAKHIGKVVCVMPETVKMTLKGVQHNSKSVVTHLFNDRSTYLITGGLGGIGLEVAKFMLSSGAKYLILASRSVAKPEVENMIKTWNESGKRVEAWQVDVGDYNQVSQMLDKIKMWPLPLRGIMHAAGVLSDGTIPNQTWEKLRTTYNAKLQGTINLHELTIHYRLEHFVLFSSVTSLFGSPGQCNHSASNAFEDAFAHYRHSIGLTATTFNWANWLEVGVATEIDFPGIRPIATSQGLRSVEAVLKSNRLQTCVMNVDSFGMLVKLFPKIKGYLDDKRLLGDVKAPVLMINTEQFWSEVDGCEEKESKIDVFKRHIKNMLQSTLKMEPDETIEDHAEFQELGVDSLMMLEMKNYLQNLFGSRLMLTAAHLKDCNNASTLATRLVDILERSKKEDNGNEGGDGAAVNLTEKLHNESDITSSLDQPTIVV